MASQNKQWRCVICGRKDNGFTWKGWICVDCRRTRREDIENHYKKLKGKQKYELVPYNFTSIDELLQERFVYWNGKLYNYGFIQGWQVGFILRNLSYFDKARLKEDRKETDK